jgi:hypothetical protein
MTKLRERDGMAPFDNGYPDERENMFRTTKSIVTP